MAVCLPIRPTVMKFTIGWSRRKVSPSPSIRIKPCHKATPLPFTVPEYPLPREAGLLIVYARISGTKGSRLIRLAVDTGATATMIPPEAALAVGIPLGRAKNFRATLTASGREVIPVVAVPRIRLFEKTLRRVPVACHALPAESPIDGLLGLDLLTRLKAVIDLAKSSIRIP